jgi:lipid A ethanolaminephosphotransferase
MTIASDAREPSGVALRSALFPGLLVHLEAQAVDALWTRVRLAWTTGIDCSSPIRLALIVSVIWATLYNGAFWHQAASAMWRAGAQSLLFFASLTALIVVAQLTLLLLIPGRRALKLVTSALFIVASASSYFCAAYGAVLNQDMMRNVVQTDRAEMSSLVTPVLLCHLLLLGIVPALAILRVNLPMQSVRRALRERGRFLATAWLLVVTGMFAASSSYAVFLRQYKPIRYALVPAAPLVSSVGLALSGLRGVHDGPLIDPGGKVQQVGVRQDRPRMILLVVGETARAEDFQLGGYARATNPGLTNVRSLAYFDRATSCGTATAVSVPCMFSPFGREDFDVGTAKHYANLLDALTGGGYDVEWWDNNAGCKSVCSRVKTIEYKDRRDPVNCPNAYCFDQVMLDDLAGKLANLQHDTVIVFHQIGSHGPAYSERYPVQSEIFTPACRTSELNRCTAEEIHNAYDNTIAYTDSVLSRQIALLTAASDHADTMLIYASDHGESLGEAGLYLHGLPYAFAPRQQKEVPMLIWTSSAFRLRSGLDGACLQQKAHDPVSHDNLYHTVLGAAGLRNAVYEPALDLFSSCVAAAPGSLAST